MAFSDPFHGDSRFLPPAVTAGSTLGGYVLQERIGQGGMAVVFLALDERLGRKVALKLLAPSLAADSLFRQRFVRESRAAAAVDHPHIIPVYEAGEADGFLFIAMRYVRGGDVRSLLASSSAAEPAGLSAQRVAGIISPVASALDAAHAAGLVHRDVKPANMLLDVQPGRPDHVYLSDFGLSKEALGATGLTSTGQFLGTVDYAAPEQIDGRPVTGATDQYALGCAAFELLCGQPPFRRDQGMAVLLAHLSEPPPRLRERRPALPAGLDPVLARALAKAPQDRFPSCGEFGDALRAALGLAPYDPDSVTRPRTEIARPGLAPQVSTTQETEATSRVKSPQPIFQQKMGPKPLDTVESRLSEPVPGKGRWRTPVVSAAAAVVLTAGIAIAVALAVQGPAAPTPGTSGTGGAGLAATRPAGSGRGCWARAPAPPRPRSDLARWERLPRPAVPAGSGSRS